MPTANGRARVREVLPDLYLGRYQPGPKNSITDVDGVLVHTQSLHESPFKKNAIVNTGVTTILPRKDWFTNSCHAGFFRFNGAGEMTGAHWIEEVGRLNSPVMLTNSFAVGNCFTGICQYATKTHCKEDGTVDWFILPVVSETYDGFLNDIAAMSVMPEHAIHGIEAACADPVAEGNTGGGTGMMTLGHKAGTGSASRVVPGITIDGNGHEQPKNFTIAALVQSNFGGLHFLRIGGAPIGRLIEKERQEAGEPQNPVDVAKDKKDGSIVVVIATDAPLHPLQCQRLAKRATSGVSRVGGWGSNQSGDLFLAFSTAETLELDTKHRWTPKESSGSPRIDDMSMDAFLEATVDVVEESIYNALCMAEDMTGVGGFQASALDLDWLKKTMERYL